MTDSNTDQKTQQDNFALVVYAHLSWDWVWQRPQQLLSRMGAQKHHVFYVMDAWVTEQEGTPKLNTDQRNPNLTLVWPVFSAAEAAEAGGNFALVGQLVDKFLAERGITNPVYWLYTPLAEPTIRNHPDQVVVFDAMDELANFRFAPQELRDLEARLMKRADLVFTGGPSLYNARKDRNPHVYLFTSGVDRAHYAQAFDPATLVPEPVASLPAPRIGFFGVIDERMDIDLVRQVAELRPDYQWILIGPTAKVEPKDLPQGPNIHYTGQRSRDDLPGFCKGFEVCMMPFAINEATKFISPTKTLEYFAAGRPVVSTPITDVVQPYSDIVYIAATPEEFAAAVDEALNASPPERERRQQLADEVLIKHEWDNIANEMLSLISASRQDHTANNA